MEIAQLQSKLDKAAVFFDEMLKDDPKWDWPHESLAAINILKCLISCEQPNVDAIAYFAGLTKREFRRSNPPILQNLANEILEWAKAQPGIQTYRKFRGIPPFGWSIEKP